MFKGKNYLENCWKPVLRKNDENRLIFLRRTNYVKHVQSQKEYQGERASEAVRVQNIPLETHKGFVIPQDQAIAYEMLNAREDYARWMERVYPQNDSAANQLVDESVTQKLKDVVAREISVEQQQTNWLWRKIRRGIGFLRDVRSYVWREHADNVGTRFEERYDRGNWFQNWIFHYGRSVIPVPGIGTFFPALRAQPVTRDEMRRNLATDTWNNIAPNEQDTVLRVFENRTGRAPNSAVANDVITYLATEPIGELNTFRALALQAGVGGLGAPQATELFPAYETRPSATPYDRLLQFRSIEATERKKRLSTVVYDATRLQNFLDTGLQQHPQVNQLVYDILREHQLYPLENNAAGKALVSYLEFRIFNDPAANQQLLFNDLTAIQNGLPEEQAQQPNAEQQQRIERSTTLSNALQESYNNMRDLYIDALPFGQRLWNTRVRLQNDRTQLAQAQQQVGGLNNQLLQAQNNVANANAAVQAAQYQFNNNQNPNTQQALAAAQAQLQIANNVLAPLAAQVNQLNQQIQRAEADIQRNTEKETQQEDAINNEFAKVLKAENKFRENYTNLINLLNQVNNNQIPNNLANLNLLMGFQPLNMQLSQIDEIFGDTQPPANAPNNMPFQQPAGSPFSRMIRGEGIIQPPPRGQHGGPAPVNEVTSDQFTAALDEARRFVREGNRPRIRLTCRQLLYALKERDFVRAGITNEELRRKYALISTNLDVVDVQNIDLYRGVNERMSSRLGSTLLSFRVLDRIRKFTLSMAGSRPYIRGEDVICFTTGINKDFDPLRALRRDSTITELRKIMAEHPEMTPDKLFAFAEQLKAVIIGFNMLKREGHVQIFDRHATELENLIHTLMIVREEMRANKFFSEVSAQDGNKAHIILNKINEDEAARNSEEEALLGMLHNQSAEYKQLFSRRIFRQKFLEKYREARKYIKDNNLTPGEAEDHLTSQDLITASREFRRSEDLKDAWSATKEGSKKTYTAVKWTMGKAWSMVSYPFRVIGALGSKIGKAVSSKKTDEKKKADKPSEEKEKPAEAEKKKK